MTDNPALSEATLSGRAVRLLSRLALAALAYVVFASLVYGGDRWGAATNIGWLRYSGLAANIVLLLLAFGWLARRNDPVAGALGPILALFSVYLLFAVMEPVFRWWRDPASVQLATLADFQSFFWSIDNVRSIAAQSLVVAVAALGMTVIIISGGIDLSAGTALALCSVVLAWCLLHEASIYVAIAAALATGCLAGLLNGLLVSSLRVVPFIITLGTMTAFLGTSKIVANETTVYPPKAGIPAWIPALVSESPAREWISWPLLPNFASGVWVTLALAVALSLVLHLTVFGRHVFAVGSSEPTARLCGIAIGRTKVLVYMLAGLFVGVAGLYDFALLESAVPTSGSGKELRIIAAVVIGGGSLTGGRGSILGTLAGAVIMEVIFSGCNKLQISNPIQDITIGVIIIAAVTLDQWRARKLAA